MEKKIEKIVFLICIALLIITFFMMFGYLSGDEIDYPKIGNNGSKTLHIISSSENKDLEPIIQEYAKSKKYDIDIEYAGTLDIMEKLNSGEYYDAVWT